MNGQLKSIVHLLLRNIINRQKPLLWHQSVQDVATSFCLGYKLYLLLHALYLWFLATAAYFYVQTPSQRVVPYLEVYCTLRVVSINSLNKRNFIQKYLCLCTKPIDRLMIIVDNMGIDLTTKIQSWIVFPISVNYTENNFISNTFMIHRHPRDYNKHAPPLGLPSHHPNQIHIPPPLHPTT